MLPVDAVDYEKRVAAATEALDAFSNQLINELDVETGGFGWWAGYSDWKTLTLVSDYLIQLIYGVSDSLLSASFSAKTHKEMCTAEEFAHKQAWKQGQMFTPNAAADRRRSLVITQSAESCFFHLGQALDRLAVAIIIVGGWHLNDAIKLDWGSLERIAADYAKGTVPATPSLVEKYEAAGSPARIAQEALLATVLDWTPHGPVDWYPWMRDARNGMTHRAGAKRMIVFTKDKRLSRVFYRQPRWSELQSIIFGGRPPRNPFWDAFILSSTEQVLEGLCESVTAMIATSVSAMTTCWEARKADPTMIVQHGKQWRLVDPSDDMSDFPGYGTITPDSKDIRLNTMDARRWEAARVMDDRRQDWYA